MGLGKAHRSKRYMDWLRENTVRCQRCSASDPDQFCHPYKRRPWGGGTSQKASDFGGLMLDGLCHLIETEKQSEAWPGLITGRDAGKRVQVKITLPIRDLLALQNLSQYAEHLDPGVDLFAEVFEYVLPRITELEGEQ